MLASLCIHMTADSMHLLHATQALSQQNFTMYLLVLSVRLQRHTYNFVKLKHGINTALTAWLWT